MVKETLQAVYDKYKHHPEFLLDVIADPNQKGAITDDTLLHICARKGDLESLTVLIDNGSDINLPGDLGNTPLHFAAMSGNLDIVKFLVVRNADIDIRNEFEQLAIDVARLSNYFDIITFLKNCK